MVIDKNIINVGDRRIKIDCIFGYYLTDDTTLIIERITIEGINEIEIEFDRSSKCKTALSELDSLLVLNIPNQIRKDKILEINKDV